MKVNIINNSQKSIKKVEYVVNFLFDRFKKSDTDLTLVYGPIEDSRKYKNLIHITENKPDCYSEFLNNFDLKKEVKASNSIDIQFDLVDFTFLMLNELPTTVSLETDLHGRKIPLSCFDYKYPVIDEIMEEIRLLLSELNQSDIVYDKDSGTCSVSHDIDNISAFDSPINLLRAFKRILSKGTILFRLKSSLILMKDLMFKNDPYYNFEFISKETSYHNMKSTYYFMVGGNTRYDGRYNFKDYLELIKELNNKQIIGLHPSYDAGFNSSILYSEIKYFEKLTNIKCEHVRYHYLRYNPISVATDLDRFAIATDTSSGFASVIGFRNGTCYPFRKWIENKECQSDTLYYPLAFMDTTALGYLSLSKHQLIEELKFIINQVDKYKGHLDLLWHNSNMYFYNDINEKELFKKALQLMRSKLKPKDPIH